MVSRVNLKGNPKKPKTQLHPLCAAVKHIREVSGLTQEEFARAINIASMTVSRFENGRQVPGDFDVLTALHNTAAKLGLEQERDLFAGLLTDRSRYRDVIKVAPELSPAVWRLTLAARAAMLINPERMGAIKEAVGAEALA